MNNNRSNGHFDFKSGSSKGSADCRAFFSHPDEVVHEPTLSVDAKRAILASWASDAHAVTDFPTIRQLENGTIVTLDSIMAALKALDEKRGGTSPPGIVLRLKDFVARQLNRDDDDPPPPPPPAAAMRLPRLVMDPALRRAA